MAVVLCLTLGLGACQTLPDPPAWTHLSDIRTRWDLLIQKRPVQMADRPMIVMKDPEPAVVPVATHVNDEFMMRLDVLDADITKLKRQLADALKENARLKKELDDAQQDNMLLRDLASKKGR
jgi:uncharacterized protein with von Willebrand factor type A (vWA) domain